MREKIKLELERIEKEKDVKNFICRGVRESCMGISFER
ncbi:hypothetical protein BF28_5225 [Bacillus cereus E33L]|nr:hypothetical protein BF28_5225 [Bacillus cereus E33L]